MGLNAPDHRSTGVAQRFLPLLAVFVACFAWVTAGHAASPETPITPGTRVWNVTAYGAKTNGTDATGTTSAINAAIYAAVSQQLSDSNQQIVYFPAGTYLVNDTLDLYKGRTASDDKVGAYIHFRGSGRSATTIRLADGAFGSTSKPVIRFFNNAGGNVSFENVVSEMTIDVGSNNPGATAIEYFNNNMGYIRNVLLKAGAGSGANGISWTRQLGGPGLLEYVEIQGFDVGIRIDHQISQVTMENITLSGQRSCGIRSGKKSVSIRHLTSNNSVPAVIHEDSNGKDRGQLVLLDSTLNGGSGGNVAIDNRNSWIFVRNVQTDGYGAALKNRGSNVAFSGNDIGEYVNGQKISLFSDTPASSNNLSVSDPPYPSFGNSGSNRVVRETDSVPYGSPPSWAIVDSDLQGDDTVALQKAFNSGAPVVALRGHQQYTISDTIVINGSGAKNVQVFTGNMARLEPSFGFIGTGKPMFRIETGPSVFLFDKLQIRSFSAVQGAVSYYVFQNNNDSTTIIRDLNHRRSDWTYRNTDANGGVTGSGDLYLVDVAQHGTNSGDAGTYGITNWIFKNQRVWARHFNVEPKAPVIKNDGGQLWILGSKLGEEYGPYLTTVNGGTTEALGVFFNNVSGAAQDDRSAVEVIDSDMTLVALERLTSTNGPHKNMIKEVRGGSTAYAIHDTNSKLETRDGGEKVVAFYRANGSSNTPPPPPGVGPTVGKSYRLKNQRYQQYLDADTDNLVDMRTDGVANDTVWKFQDAGAGYIYLLNAEYNGRLDADESGSTNIYDVDLAASGDTQDDKKWDLVEAGDGSYFVTNKLFNRNLDGDTGDNVDLAETVDATNSDQRWELEEVTTSSAPTAGKSYRLKNQQYSQYLDADGGGLVDMKNTADSDTVWKLQDAGAGYFYLLNVDLNGRLDADESGNPATYDVDLALATDAANDKKWQIVAAGDGSYYVVNKLYNRKLDGDTGDAVDLTDTAAATNPDQRWIFELVP